MADLKRTIEIFFGGVDDVSGVTGNIDRSVTQLSRTVSGVTGPLAGMADSLFAVDAAIAAAGGALVAFSINEAGRFVTSTNEINTLLDVSGDAFNDLRQDILDYGRDSTAGLADVEAATYSAISAGVAYDDALGALSVAEKLSVGGKAALNDSLVTIVSTLNAYGESTEHAADVSDVLFTAVKFGQTTIPELSASLAQVTGTAAAAGVPFDTLAAAIAGLTATGLPTSQAITGIKAALSNIIKPSTEAGKAASELGVEFSLAALQSQGLEGFLGSLQTATGGNVDAMGRFFGSTEALNAVLGLAGKGAAKFEAALSGMEDRSGATAAAFAKMADNVDLVVQNLVNNLDATLIQAGLPLLDEFVAGLRALSDVFRAIGTGIDQGAFDPILLQLEGFGQDAVAALERIAANLPAALAGVDFSPLTNAASSIGGAFADVFDAGDLSSVEGLTAAIQRVVDILGTLGEITAGTVRGLEPLIDAALLGAEAFSEMDEGVAQGIGNVLGLSKSIETLTPAVTGLFGGLNALTTALTAFVGVKAVKEIAGIGTASATAAGFLGKAGLAGAAGLAGFELGKMLRDNRDLFPWVNSLGEAIGEFAAQVVMDGDRIWDDFFGGGSAAAQQLGTDVQTALDTLIPKEPIALPIEPAFDIDAITAFGDALVGVVPVSDDLSALVDGTTELTKETGLWVASVEDGITVYNQVGGFAATALDAATQATTEATKATDDYLLKLLEIQSDERLGALQIGADIDIAGIEAETKRVLAAFDSINVGIESTGSVINKAFDNLKDDGGVTNLDALRQLKAENARRDQEFRDQGRLVDAQIDAMRAQADALNRGDPLITVNGDGLAPHLEAMMFEVFQAIQVKGQSQPGSYLVGCSA